MGRRLQHGVRLSHLASELVSVSQEAEALVGKWGGSVRRPQTLARRAGRSPGAGEACTWQLVRLGRVPGGALYPEGEAESQ